MEDTPGIEPGLAIAQAEDYQSAPGLAVSNNGAASIACGVGSITTGSAQTVDRQPHRAIGIVRR